MRPGHTSVQLFVSGAGSREGSHSLNSLLEQPGVIVPAPWSQRQGCASRLQRALCLLTPALGAGRQWWPLGHPQTRGSGCAHPWKLCCPPEKQTLAVSWSARCHCLPNSLHCCQQPLEPGRELSPVPRAWVSCRKPVGKCTETSVKLLRGFTGEQSCRVLSGQWACRPARTVPASRKSFVELSFSCAVVIVRLFQNVIALRVVIYILNVLTPGL